MSKGQQVFHQQEHTPSFRRLEPEQPTAAQSRHWVGSLALLAEPLRPSKVGTERFKCEATLTWRTQNSHVCMPRWSKHSRL